MPSTIPALASSPLEPVTTTLAAAAGGTYNAIDIGLAEAAHRREGALAGMRRRRGDLETALATVFFSNLDLRPGHIIYAIHALEHRYSKYLDVTTGIVPPCG